MATQRGRSDRYWPLLITDLRASVGALIERGAFELAFRTVAHALGDASSTAVQQDLLEVLLLVPRQARLSSAYGALLTVRLLGNTRQAQETLTFTREARAHLSGAALASVLAYEAWALTHSGEHEQALSMVEHLLPLLSGPMLGIAWRARGQAQAALGHADWRAAFSQARGHLDGRALGTCWLEEGSLLERAGDPVRARAAWREGLLLLEHDAYYTAWLQHALGLSCLRQALPEAEDHFLVLQRLAGRAQVAQFRARALCGLAATRRALGEWGRAEAAYRQAIKVAGEEDDQRQAWRGLGHTQRLAGKPELALEALLRATRVTDGDRRTGQSWVFADVAAAHAQCSHLNEARAALERTGDLEGEDAERAAIVRAELARRAGDEAQALQELGVLSPGTLWVREERECFPELFALLSPAARPAPLSRPPLTRVEVRALGTLTVYVNGRQVPLGATGRPGELLVFLLERGGRAPTKVIADELYPGSALDTRRAGRAVWALARKLRDVLGWEASVRFGGGGYALDPTAQWWYDVREALVRGEPTPAFLTGVCRPWAEERAQELALRDSNLISGSQFF